MSFRLSLRAGVLRCVLGIGALAAIAAIGSLHAQPNGGGNGGGVSVSAGPAGGIKVDAGGVVDLLEMPEGSTELIRQKAKAMKAQAGANQMKASTMRMVSLTRLEKAVAAKLAKGEKPDDEMLNLAGLTRIQFVFLYPETKDIVIAGPAEGFISDPTGRMIGTESGRATVQLEDLVVALRAFAPNQKGAAVIGCSIDATKEGLANLQKAMNEVGRRVSGTRGLSPEQANQYAAGLRDALGLQNVTVNGVSPKTHFAKVLVEADYKMKLIGLGMDTKPVKQLKSYVDVASTASMNRNSMKRWFFLPNYECVRVADDAQAMELVGEGVKLVGEDEVVGSDGSRRQTGTSDKASKTFTDGFTKHYGEIARRASVYGQLRNVIDLSIMAAFMQKKDYFAKAEWKMDVFGDEKQFAVETHNAPTQVRTACLAKVSGKGVSFPIGGGVHIQPKQALNDSNLLSDEEGNVAKRRENVNLKDLPAGQWWWD